MKYGFQSVDLQKQPEVLKRGSPTVDFCEYTSDMGRIETWVFDRRFFLIQRLSVLASSVQLFLFIVSDLVSVIPFSASSVFSFRKF